MLHSGCCVIFRHNLSRVPEFIQCPQRMTVSTSFPLFDTKEFAYLYCSDNPVPSVWSSKESNLWLLPTVYLFLSSQEEFGTEDPFRSWHINRRCWEAAGRPAQRPEHWKLREQGEGREKQPAKLVTELSSSGVTQLHSPDIIFCILPSSALSHLRLDKAYIFLVLSGQFCQDTDFPACS